MAISTSGNSKNVNKALEIAPSYGVKTIALLGKNGGEAIGLADISILVPSESTARIQESHALIGHIICDLVEKNWL